MKRSSLVSRTINGRDFSCVCSVIETKRDMDLVMLFYEFGNQSFYLSLSVQVSLLLFGCLHLKIHNS